MTKRLFSYDALEGTAVYFTGDGKGGFELVTESEDKQWERDACVQMANEGDEWGQGMKRGWTHYAHIPNHILHQWMLEGIDRGDMKALFDKVNSREWCMLKTVHKFHTPSHEG